MVNINAEPKPSYELTEEELDKVTVGRKDHEPLISQIVITKDADSQSHKLWELGVPATWPFFFLGTVGLQDSHSS